MKQTQSAVPTNPSAASLGRDRREKSEISDIRRFSRPPKGEINTSIIEGTKRGRLDLAATPPAEASGVGGAMPTVRKEKGVVLVRDRVRLVRSGRGVAG